MKNLQAHTCSDVRANISSENPRFSRRIWARAKRIATWGSGRKFGEPVKQEDIETIAESLVHWREAHARVKAKAEGRLRGERPAECPYHPSQWWATCGCARDSIVEDSSRRWRKGELRAKERTARKKKEEER
jgi:hypothetical protein